MPTWRQLLRDKRNCTNCTNMRNCTNGDLCTYPHSSLANALKSTLTNTLSLFLFAHAHACQP